MKRIYINEKVCIGCHLCEVYCQLHQAQSIGLIKAFKREAPRLLPGLRIEEKDVVSLSVRCQHCDEAPCVQACLTGALTRNPVNHTVKLDEERCIGCWTCLLVCPLSAVMQNTIREKVLKCDLCQGDPECVKYCVYGALQFVEAAEAAHSKRKARAEQTDR